MPDDRVIPFTEHKLHGFIWMPLEAQGEDGPKFLCIECHWAWTATLAAPECEWWVPLLNDMRQHMLDHDRATGRDMEIA